MTTPNLSERLAEVRQRMAAACGRANRSTDSVTLIAVSKTHPAETVLEAIANGQFHFGENRVEEAIGKIAQVQAALPSMEAVGNHATLTWHMIGHVQSRKARDVIAQFDVIHSVDSVKLAERYSRFAVEIDAEQNRPHRILLEINISGEASKSGFSAEHWEQDRSQREALWSDVRQMLALPGLYLDGLMTVAPIAENPEEIRPLFTRLRMLRDALATEFPAATWGSLSMGMTDDFPVAIEEGATMVRIGRAIFGARD